MMDARRVATTRVMKTIARRGATDPLKIIADDGTRPVVVTLPEDDLKSTIERVDAYGGRANVFVAFQDWLALIECVIDVDAPESEEIQAAHGNTTMAMYVEFLKLHVNQAAMINVSISDSASAQSRIKEVAYAL